MIDNLLIAIYAFPTNIIRMRVLIRLFALFSNWALFFIILTLIYSPDWIMIGSNLSN